jgi:hypothetical protein
MKKEKCNFIVLIRNRHPVKLKEKPNKKLRVKCLVCVVYRINVSIYFVFVDVFSIEQISENEALLSK